MGKENQRPPASRFLFIITPLFPHCTPLSACVGKQGERGEAKLSTRQTRLETR